MQFIEIQIISIINVKFNFEIAATFCVALGIIEFLSAADRPIYGCVCVCMCFCHCTYYYHYLPIVVSVTFLSIHCAALVVECTENLCTKSHLKLHTRNVHAQMITTDKISESERNQFEKCMSHVYFDRSYIG